MRWDANWYREIIRHGYRYYPGVQSSVAYFPAYPVTVVAIAWAFPGVPAAAITVTVLSGLGAAVLFHRWCSERMSPAAATTALLVLLVYPYAWYLYGAVYSDAFFLMLVLCRVRAGREGALLAGRGGGAGRHGLAPDRHRRGHRPGAGGARAGQRGRRATRVEDDLDLVDLARRRIGRSP